MEGTAIAIATDRRRQWLCFVIVCCAAHLAVMTRTSGADGPTPIGGAAPNGNTPHVTETTPGGYVQLDVAMKNMTKYEGDTLRIKCEITGYPLPRYQWFKDDVQLDNMAANEGRHNVRTTPWGSRLKISKLAMDDSGSYVCVGFNRFGRQTTNGELSVKQGPNPNRGSSKSDRDSYDLDFDLDSDVFESDADSSSIYHQHLYPDADGVLRPGGQSTTPKLARFRQSDANADADAVDVGGFCQPYLGATCSRFVGNKSIFVKDEYQQGHIEERLTTAFTLLATIPGGLSLSCGQYAIPAMCYFAFALCDEGLRSPPRPRSLCRDECGRLAAGPCRREYASAQAARQMNPLTADKRFLLPDCGQLVQSNNCVTIGIPRLTDRGNCYNGTGKDYKGIASKTVSGKDCQHWGSIKSPYEPSLISISQHSELADHNYCRNPDHSMGAPWCFTLSGDKLTKELCAVEKCRYPVEEEDEGLTKMLVVLVPCITVASLIAILATVVQVRRRRRLAKQKSFLAQSGANKVQMSALLKANPQKYQELPLSSVVIVEELGEGRFGKVYRGELISHGRLAIAVRAISPSAPWKTQAEFWSEIERLAELLHPNITCLVGVVTNDIPASIVQEYSPAGDLHVYLTANGKPTPEEESGRPFLYPKDLISIAVQVAAGMEYLSTMSYVHRDLAARNVIMAGNGLVKVSTVSFTNSAYARDYYYPVGSCQPIPLRWLPPEAIFQDHFTTYTDVWSFGVLLWEIYSFGQVPYHGYADESAVEMIGYHQILACPVDCPSRIYSLMVECWHKTPSKRPDFRDVHATLRQLMTELCGQTADILVCQMFPGNNRSSSSGNNTTNTSISAPFSAAFNADAIDVQGTLNMVPEAGLQRNALPFPAVHNSYPQHHMGVVPPANQTPKYKKRPLPTSSSSQNSSSPSSSFCSSYNPFSRVGSDYGATDNCLVSQEPSSRWMETMFEDVVI